MMFDAPTYVFIRHANDEKLPIADTRNIAKVQVPAHVDFDFAMELEDFLGEFDCTFPCIMQDEYGNVLARDTRKFA